MSKRFVDVDELKEFKKGVVSILDKNGDDLSDLVMRVETIKDVVNRNAENGEELEKRVNDLEKRIDILRRASRDLRADVDVKNSNGVVLASMVGIAGIFGFLWLMSEITRIENLIKKQESSVKQQKFEGKNVEVGTIEVTYREDGTDVKSETESKE